MEELLKNKKIALATGNRSAYSETFIKAQIDLLPAAIVLHSGFLPNMIGDNLIINKYKEYINTCFRPIINGDLFSLEKALTRILKKEKIEVVLAQFGHCGSAVNELCKKAKIPLFVHFHGFDASDKSTLENYSEKFKVLFSDAKGIIAVSNAMKAKLIEIGCPIEKITLCHYGPNDKFFNLVPSYNCHTFFGIGRFVDKKAPYLTLLAFKEVLEKVPDAKLIIAGDGVLMNTCRNITKAYKIEESVSFPGILKQEEIMIYMENSLAFVQHSVIADSGDSEGTPLAVLEASAAALPVIATFHAGIPDVVINNETGILVKEYDILGMATSMLKLIENKQLAKAMGASGRDRIKSHFTMGKYISTLRNLINTH